MYDGKSNLKKLPYSKSSNNVKVICKNNQSRAEREKIKRVKEEIFANQIRLKDQDIPKNWSKEAADFINKLLNRKSENRLGARGPEEVKSHPWLKNVNWDLMKKQKIKAPYLPGVIIRRIYLNQ